MWACVHVCMSMCTYVHVGMWGWGQVCACVHVHVHVCARGHANVLLREFCFVSFSFCHVCNAHMSCVCMSFFIAYPGGHVSMWAGVHVGMWASGQVSSLPLFRSKFRSFRFVSLSCKHKCACLRTAVCVSSLVAAACGHADMACEHMGMWACEPVGMCVCVNV